MVDDNFGRINGILSELKKLIGFIEAAIEKAEDNEMRRLVWSEIRDNINGVHVNHLSSIVSFSAIIFGNLIQVTIKDQC